MTTSDVRQIVQAMPAETAVQYLLEVIEGEFPVLIGSEAERSLGVELFPGEASVFRVLHKDMGSIVPAATLHRAIHFGRKPETPEALKVTTNLVYRLRQKLSATKYVIRSYSGGGFSMEVSE